jgi:hypothetical protein
MTDQTTEKWSRFSLALSLITCVLAFFTALVRYVHSGEVELTGSALAACLAGLIYFGTRQNKSRKE